MVGEYSPHPDGYSERYCPQKGKDGLKAGAELEDTEQGARAGCLLGASQSQQPLNSLQREAD